ncbi:MAG: AAA family ATPase [Lachnospiraceae bacterium]|nr:AAA family ATPase [Lachnospiraceae bacterium]
MKRTVAIGRQNFAAVREGNFFYIDKTNFIKEWWEGGDECTLITRPRRFGKTLNMSMMEHFFSVDYQGREDLFEGLSVWSEEKYRQLQGTYPVLFLSFARVKETTYEKCYHKINEIIRNLYIKYSFLLDSDKLMEVEKEFINRMLDIDIGREEDLSSSLYQLCSFLERYYGKKVIILLDEYDTPMQEAYVEGYWEEIVSFIRSLFNSTFKTNPHLERGLMTGITRVSKESIFSDLNHLKVVTTTSEKYATCFGFTQEEVFGALEEYGLSEEKEKVKKWYDGFIFGKTADIYNPWSIINFLDTKQYEPYWANTSSNELINTLLRGGNKKIKTSFEVLLEGKSIHCPIEEQVVYGALGDNEEAIWSLLVAAGYLKILSYEKAEDLKGEREPKYEVTLTNFEVKRMFSSMVRRWFYQAEAEYSDFLMALLQGDVDAMNEYMNRISLEMFSYFDTGKKAYGSDPERFYHGFVLGLLVELKDRYLITSNRESGFGRYDIVMEPKKEELPAIIIEFKVFNKRKEKDLEETVAAALAQIEEKQYEKELIIRGIAKERIKKYGFAFLGKEVLIGEG